MRKNVTRSSTVKSYQKMYLKYPDIVNPFAKNEEIAKTLVNNANDAKIMAEHTCQKLMDVDIVKKKDQKIGEQTPKYLVCLP